eukprot:gene23585-9113_t
MLTPSAMKVGSVRSASAKSVVLPSRRFSRVAVRSAAPDASPISVVVKESGVYTMQGTVRKVNEDRLKVQVCTVSSRSLVDVYPMQKDSSNALQAPFTSGHGTERTHAASRVRRSV